VSRRIWLLVAPLIATLVAIILLTPQQQESSPDHRSDSFAPDGTSALFALAEKSGYRVHALTSSFALSNGGLLFVFSPDQAYTQEEALAVSAWVRRGGTLVYADATGDQPLDRELGIRHSGAASGPTLVGVPAPGARATGPFLAGVDRVTMGAVAGGLAVGPEQVPLLETDAGNVVALEVFAGAGRIVVLSDPLELCNHLIGEADNARLAADVIGLAPPGSAVTFDEFHHGAAATSPLDWALTPWGAPIFWAIAVAYGALLLRGRSFGPRLSLQPGRGRSSAEYTSAVGKMLRRASARELTLRVLTEAARRALAERTGLGHSTPPARVQTMLAVRAPELAQRLARAETSTAAATASDAGLLAAARELHELAYPSPR